MSYTFCTSPQWADFLQEKACAVRHPKADYRHVEENSKYRFTHFIKESNALHVLTLDKYKCCQI